MEISKQNLQMNIHSLIQSLMGNIGLLYNWKMNSLLDNLNFGESKIIHGMKKYAALK